MQSPELKKPVSALTETGPFALDSDLDQCRAIMRAGSKSFHAASLLLPTRVRRPAAAVYAFCRVSDDAVDLAQDPARALEQLHVRLDSIYTGSPRHDAVDRMLADVVREHRIPRTLFEALLDGYLWDVEGRRYETLSGVMAYSARVASAVGAIMTVLMGPREAHVMARACDLGVAMQLTNICRDVGEDARAGRIYLPLAWMRRAGIEPELWLRNPVFSPALGDVVRRVLEEAATLYRRADAGIAFLPRDCRVSIRAASLIYSDIGRVIRKNGYDSVSQRAVTSGRRKLWLAMRAIGATFWAESKCEDPALGETSFLVDAIAGEHVSSFGV
ncbi:MAG: phytoene/squalene synthase family protein [Myxococcota bacterium]